MGPTGLSVLQPPVTHYLEREVIGTVRFSAPPPGRSASGHYLEREVIGTDRSLRPAAYDHSLSRKGSDWDRQVSQPPPGIMISIQRFTTRFV